MPGPRPSRAQPMRSSSTTASAASLARAWSSSAPGLGGGGRHGDRGCFIEPAVLTNTSPDMKVVREEIFGPVLVAAPFSDLDEIAAVANDSEYGLGAGIWTKDISKAHALAKK